MKLSSRGKYGMYAMVYLAKQAGNGPQPLKAIAGAGIPEPYLEQLLGSLRRSGLVETVRGVQGGYMLARTPMEITVGDVLNATEGPLHLAECVSEERSCKKSKGCASRMVWEYLDDKINDVLHRVTLGEMLDKSGCVGADTALLEEV